MCIRDSYVDTLRQIVHDVDQSPSLELLGPTTEVPNLSREQVCMALSAMPSDYWQLVCWSCRGAGHSSFSCPYLTIPQRLFFALCYYRYQVAANPKLSHWFAQKLQAKVGQGPDPGKKPYTVLPKQGRGQGRRDRTSAVDHLGQKLLSPAPPAEEAQTSAAPVPTPQQVPGN